MSLRSLRALCLTSFFIADVRDGLGGHSGGDIHLGRANANKLVARFLFNLMKKGEVEICEIDAHLETVLALTRSWRASSACVRPLASRNSRMVFPVT